MIYENQFNSSDGSASPFTFNSAHGGQAILSAADVNGNLTGYRTVAAFDAAANGVSFGRYTNSAGKVDFVAASSRTFGVDNPVSVDQFRTGKGARNAAALVGPIIFNELMFYPPLIGGLEDDTLNEYHRVVQHHGGGCRLFDPSFPTNTWQIQGGVDYRFPPDVTLAAGSFLLLVNFDPAIDLTALAEFRARYPLIATVPIFGPYSGHLANGGERLTLYRPDAPQLPPHPDAGFVPSVSVEQIDYVDAAPWPSGAGGTGSSLQRVIPLSFGNDPANWFVGQSDTGPAEQG